MSDPPLPQIRATWSSFYNNDDGNFYDSDDKNTKISLVLNKNVPILGTFTW